jgi:hypothetical protein
MRAAPSSPCAVIQAKIENMTMAVADLPAASLSCWSRTSQMTIGQASRCRTIAPAAQTAHVASGDKRANMSMNRRQLSVRSWAMSQRSVPGFSRMLPVRPWQ